MTKQKVKMSFGFESVISVIIMLLLILVASRHQIIIAAKSVSNPGPESEVSIT